MSKPGLLVLCTGNSCRSQMAEALFRAHAGDRFTVHSAGTEPALEIHPMAREVMAEAGHDLAGQRPKRLEGLLESGSIGTVVIVCDSADRSCPTVWPGAYERLFWPFEDPAAFVGDEPSTRAKFRAIRDAIETRIVDWLADASSPRSV